MTFFWYFDIGRHFCLFRVLTGFFKDLHKNYIYLSLLWSPAKRGLSQNDAMTLFQIFNLIFCLVGPSKMKFLQNKLTPCNFVHH